MDVRHARKKTSGYQSKEVNTNLCAVEGDQPENATRFSSTISRKLFRLSW
jgi:hypothetical protein